MNASQVISELNNTWTSLLSQYYDKVANEHLKCIAETYNLPISDLQNKSQHLKSEILSQLTKCVDTAQTKTNENINQKPHEKDYNKMSRKELQEECKKRGIATKRKNADMVTSISEFDLNAEEPKVEEPKVEEPKVEEPKVEEPKVEEPKVEEPKVEEPKIETKKKTKSKITSMLNNINLNINEEEEDVHTEENINYNSESDDELAENMADMTEEEFENKFEELEPDDDYTDDEL